MLQKILPRAFKKYQALPIFGSVADGFSVWCHRLGYSVRVLQPQNPKTPKPQNPKTPYYVNICMLPYFISDKIWHYYRLLRNMANSFVVPVEFEPLIENELEPLKSILNSAHQRPADDIIRCLKTNPKTGLTQDEADIRLANYGKNLIPRSPPPTMFEQIAEQFEDVLVRILLIAACISFFIALTDDASKDWTAYVEPIVILLILIANATIGVWQEMKSEKALDALLILQADKAQVLRDGKEVVINASDIVPGDICILRSGDKVPADIRLIKVMALKVNQSILTGESSAVSKNADQIVSVENATNQDKVNMLFSSTEIAVGEATGVVVGIGEASQLGKIKDLIDKASEENKKTPLQEKLDEFGNLLSLIILVICGLSWLVNLQKFFDPIHGNAFRGAIYYFRIAVSLAVAAIPEGLPAVITTCLALATTRMAENNAIVRHLASVETLGCTTVICTDKTGTLTVNTMTVGELSYMDNSSLTIVSNKVTGEGLKLEGNVEGINSEQYLKNIAIHDIANICALCNDAKLKKSDNNEIKVCGTATEGSLKVLLHKLSQYDTEFQANVKLKGELEGYVSYIKEKWAMLGKLPFTQTRKCMSVIVRGFKGQNIILLKGAPDMLLEKCTKVKYSNGEIGELKSDMKNQILQKIKEASKSAYRCLAFASKENLSQEFAEADENKINSLVTEESQYSNIESEATFLGYVGIKDPARPTVAKAIKQCKKAGIHVIMITGDNKETAVAIAKELKLVDPDNEDPKKYMDGREFDSLENTEEKTRRIKEGACVFSRVEPRHKTELVKILKNSGEIVAMTGDGVNDAPAIGLAHIGISMGLAGTDVAKEASKLILADDNFATIVMAIEEGRGIYTNIKAFIRYLISSNIGEVVAIFVTSLLGFPEVLSSVHLLWINLVTDGLPATALGFNPAEPDAMEQKPRKSDEQIINGWTLVRYFVIGTYVGIATIAIFVHYFLYMNNEDGHSLISWKQLTTWSECPEWPSSLKNFQSFDGFNLTANPCSYFTVGKIKASTLSLTVLVVIEMFNAMNALSEHSLLKLPLWKNPWLCLAIFSSMFLHFTILYVPLLKKLFGVSPLNLTEWVWVVLYSFPIIILDEIMKLIGNLHKKLKNK